MRGENETDDAVDASVGEGVDGGLDARFDVTQPDGDDELAGATVSSAGGIATRCASVRSASGLSPPIAS